VRKNNNIPFQRWETSGAQHLLRAILRGNIESWQFGKEADLQGSKCNGSQQRTCGAQLCFAARSMSLFQATRQSHRLRNGRLAPQKRAHGELAAACSASRTCSRMPRRSLWISTMPDALRAIIAARTM